MFKIKPDDCFTAEVSLPVPGKPAAKVKFVFRHKTRSEAAAFFDRCAEAAREEVGGDENPGVRGARLLGEIVAGWEDVDTPFSPESFAELLENYPKAGYAISRAYTEELMLAREGN